MTEHDPQRRADRSSNLRWTVIAPILAAIFLLGLLLGTLLGAVAF